MSEKMRSQGSRNSQAVVTNVDAMDIADSLPLRSYLMGALKTDFKDLKRSFVTILPGRAQKDENGLLEELFRYLYLLAANSADGIVRSFPSSIVDKALRMLMLLPRLYYRVCDQILQMQGDTHSLKEMRVLPYEARSEANSDHYDEMLERYEDTFSSAAPPLWWPKSSKPQINDMEVKCETSSFTDEPVNLNEWQEAPSPVVAHSSSSAAKRARSPTEPENYSLATDSAPSSKQVKAAFTLSVKDTVVEPVLAAMTASTLPASAPRSTVARPMNNEMLKDWLAVALRQLTQHDKNTDPSFTFAEDVTSEGYSELIPNPMSLERMQKNLNAGFYHSIGDFEAHLQLMVDNCKKYNGLNNPYSLQGDKLLTKWQWCLNKKEQLLEKVTMAPTNQSYRNVTIRSYEGGERQYRNQDPASPLEGIFIKYASEPTSHFGLYAFSRKGAELKPHWTLASIETASTIDCTVQSLPVSSGSTDTQFVILRFVSADEVVIVRAGRKSKFQHAFAAYARYMKVDVEDLEFSYLHNFEEYDLDPKTTPKRLKQEEEEVFDITVKPV